MEEHQAAQSYYIYFLSVLQKYGGFGDFGKG